MFDFIRKHNKWAMGLMFMLIVPSFVLLGLDGYKSTEQGAAVAMVDGNKILQSEWDRAHQIEVDRVRASAPNIDIKLLDSPEARYATLERMVRDRVVAAAALKFKLATSNERLARELQQSPEIASLRGPDGKLDMERYRQLVGSQGMTPEMFEANVRNDISNRQVLGGIGASGFSSGATADISLNAYLEKRQIQLARFDVADFAGKLTPSDADLEQFYKANEKLFQAPEQAKIEYVVLDLDAMKKTVSLNEADVRTYYDQNILRLSGGEQRRASHILIASPKTASPADRAKAKAKAQELLEIVKKAPASFADVARKNSEDPGSAPNGGDLDFFARGAMVKPFEDAAFSLKKDDISEVIESDFGYHIIKLAEIKTPKQKTFEEMRPELEADLKKQEAQKKFAETAEAFTNGVYEQADSLKPTAERLKLDIKTASNVTRKPAAGATGALASTKFLDTLFAPDAIDKKRNTVPVEIASSQLVSGRIVEYAGAHTQAFTEVKDNVRQRWLAQHAAEAARKEGAVRLAAWKAAPASAVLAAPMVVSREQTEKLPPALVDAALRADSSALPAFVGVDLGAQGYAVVKVDKVVPRDPPAADIAKQERNQYSQWWTNAENLAYYNGLKGRFKAEVLVPKPIATKPNPEEVLTQ